MPTTTHATRTGPRSAGRQPQQSRRPGLPAGRDLERLQPLNEDAVLELQRDSGNQAVVQLLHVQRNGTTTTAPPNRPQPPPPRPPRTPPPGAVPLPGLAPTPPTTAPTSTPTTAPTPAPTGSGGGLWGGIKKVATYEGPKMDTAHGGKTAGKVVGKIALGIADGAVNAFLAPVNPRFWVKAINDIKSISKDDYGGGVWGNICRALGITSQVAQKLGTLFGIAALITGILGAVTWGAGAAVSAILSLCAMIAFGVAALLQVPLMATNVVAFKKGGDTKRRKRFWSDLGAFIGSALGVVSGGIGTDFSQGLGGAKAVIEGSLSGYTEVGKVFAGSALMQPLGSTGDATSEGLATIQQLPIPGVQRQGDKDGEPSPQNKDHLQAMIELVGAARGETGDAGADMAGIAKAKGAAEKVSTAMGGPLPAVAPPKGVKGSMPAVTGVDAGPTLVSNAEQSKSKMDEIDKDERPVKGDQGSLEKQEQDLADAETKLGLTAKPTVGKRVKRFFGKIGGVLAKLARSIRKRVRKIIAKAREMVMNAMIDILGLRKDVNAMNAETPGFQNQLDRDMEDTKSIQADAPKAAAGGQALIDACKR
jgi:hypothetical protein